MAKTSRRKMGGNEIMLRSEVISGLKNLRYDLETGNVVPKDSRDIEYYEEILYEATLAVLLNEQNDPHAKMYKR